MTQSIENYLSSFQGDILERLCRIQTIVREEAPDAVESISYGLLAWKMNGKPLVYTGGFTHHIGFYATPSGHKAIADELAIYKQGKGSVQFPLDMPLPEQLIRDMVRIRVEQVSE